MRPDAQGSRSNSQAEGRDGAYEQLGSMSNPPKPLYAVTHMVIADSVALCEPGPNFSKHHAHGRHHQRKEQSHCGSGNPTVFGWRILVPNQPGHCCGGQTVEQHKWEVNR